jgi:hypothetical protein
MEPTILVIVILGIMILALLAERWFDRERNLRMQDMLNRALIARSVPEYEATAKSEIAKLKTENELAIHAESALKGYATQEEEEGFPVT